MAFEYLAQYTTFNSVSDMDKSVEDHIAAHYYDLTESERSIVFALASRSLAYPGSCHLKAETIAEQTGTSRSTVMRAIKKLVSLNIIEKVKQTKLNGIKGASIYRILPYNDTSEMKHREDAYKASDNAVCLPQFEEVSISSFNLSTSTLQEVYESAHAEKEAHKEYMNEYQVMLFDFMHSLPLRDDLKDQLHKCVLATKMNNIRDFVNAKDVLVNIIRDIVNGTLTITSTLRAVFVGAYSKAVERLNKKSSKSSSVEGKEHRGRPVPFYNWLNERDSLPQSNSSRIPNLENWLEW